MSNLRRPEVATCAALLALLAIERAHPANGLAFVPKALQREAREWVYHGTNTEDELGLLAGYYDELLNASRDSTHADAGALWQKGLNRSNLHEWDRSFLLYRPLPRLGDPTDPAATHVTSAERLFDRDYPLERTPGVRRIAWVGDSLSRGLGAPFGQALEPRVERWLNATQAGDGTSGFEVLNLAVEGYRTTQFVRVVEEALERFAPDAVLLGLSDLSVTRIWGRHLAALVHDGIDLEYPFLRELAQRARLAPDDAPTVTDQKLAPFADELVAWALDTMSARCRERGVALVVALLPAVGEPRRLDGRFRSARRLLAERELPTLDLVATFADVPDLRPWRVSDIDHHPNSAGYERLFERFVAELRGTPAAAGALLGRTAVR